MNLKFRFNDLRRRSLLILTVIALSTALLPTAAFAAGPYGSDRKPDNYQGQHQRPRQQKQNTHKDSYNHCATTYKVKRGDNLTKISRSYRVSIHQLAKSNGLKNPNLIYVGQNLCIPK